MSSAEGIDREVIGIKDDEEHAESSLEGPSVCAPPVSFSCQQEVAEDDHEAGVAAVMTEPVCAEVIIVPVSCVTMESTAPRRREHEELAVLLVDVQEECVMSIRIISASNAVP